TCRPSVLRPAATAPTYPLPYTTLFRSETGALRRLYKDSVPPLFGTKEAIGHLMGGTASVELAACLAAMQGNFAPPTVGFDHPARSEEHTSELQSRENLVCRLLLEKKNI